MWQTLSACFIELLSKMSHFFFYFQQFAMCLNVIFLLNILIEFHSASWIAAAAAKLRQSCLTLCDPIDSSLPGSSVPGILQARILEWVAISFSSAWKWKWKWSRSVMSDPSQPHGLQPTRPLRPWDFPGKSTGVGCHRLLWKVSISAIKSVAAAEHLTLWRGNSKFGTSKH